MKKFLKAFCLVPLTAVVAVAGCNSSPYAIFKKATGVSVPDCGGVTTIDTTGWFGDGELIYMFYLDEENGLNFENTVQSAEHWQALPMTETLNRVVYESLGGKISRVENGYYFFYDEQHKTYDDGKLEDSYSYDFVIGMYDTETRTAYYYEQHT